MRLYMISILLCSSSLTRAQPPNTTEFAVTESVILLHDYLKAAANGTEAASGEAKAHGARIELGVCTHHAQKVGRYPVAQFDWCHVQLPLTVAGWIVLTSIVEIVFHISKRIPEHVPDSALLIALGILLGLVLKFSIARPFHMSSDTFFLYLLPPVVFEAGYSMPARAFFENFGSIICYSVLGTIFNTAAIGGTLYAISLTGIFAFAPSGLSIFSALLFSSLISAVDPVAVLVVFEEIRVNEVLFILIFGESLLNDAVSVVLYRVFGAFRSMDEILPIDYVDGVISFFVSSVCGSLIGLLCGLAATFITRWTGHVRVLEPLIVLMMAYSSYLLAELFHFSGILAISFCGICMKWYMQNNISHKSVTTVKYFLKMLCRCCECIMFMFLGVSVVSDNHLWSTGFVLFTILFCLVYRFMGVIMQTAVLNKFRIRKLKRLDQFIMGFSGLRGAIAYWLVEAIDAEVVGPDVKRAFITATVSVILFTVFVQGTTIKPLVHLLDVELNELNLKSMHHHVFSDCLDHTMSGIESISHIRGSNWVRDKFNLLNQKILNPAVMKMPNSASHSNILDVYKKLSFADALKLAHDRTSSPLPSHANLSRLNLAATSNSGLHLAVPSTAPPFQPLRVAPTGGGLDLSARLSPPPALRSAARFTIAEEDETSPKIRRHVSFVAPAADEKVEGEPETSSPMKRHVSFVIHDDGSHDGRSSDEEEDTKI